MKKYWKWIGLISVLALLAGSGCQKDKAKPVEPSDKGKIVLPDTVVDIGNGTTLKMVVLPGGTFQMGSNAAAEEQPVHSVTVTGFSIGMTEITQDFYTAVMGTNPSSFGGDTSVRLPVDRVSWYDAALFCNALSKLKGRDTVYIYSGVIDANVVIDYSKNGYRLPTEAEWEYACRAGTTADYYWGAGYPLSSGADTLAADDNAVWEHNSNSRTGGVAAKNANGWGLFGMSGNVWEWANDWQGSYTDSAKTDPIGASTGLSRVLRGGSWSNPAGNLRSSYRGSGSYPDYRGNVIGFRIACRP
jgi:formylglycine-generating enzyme required for sulfatase activity